MFAMQTNQMSNAVSNVQRNALRQKRSRSRAKTFARVHGNSINRFCTTVPSFVFWIDQSAGDAGGISKWKKKVIHIFLTLKNARNLDERKGKWHRSIDDDDDARVFRVEAGCF